MSLLIAVTILCANRHYYPHNKSGEHSLAVLLRISFLYCCLPAGSRTGYLDLSQQPTRESCFVQLLANALTIS